jgi:hypothetical protein
MPDNVMCEVNNCTFWAQGNMCQADKIYVVAQREEQADSTEETDCHTFEPKHH